MLSIKEIKNKISLEIKFYKNNKNIFKNLIHE
jgi:hypothetical protein